MKKKPQKIEIKLKLLSGEQIGTFFVVSDIYLKQMDSLGYEIYIQRMIEKGMIDCVEHLILKGASVMSEKKSN